MLFRSLLIPGVESALLGTLHGDPEKTIALMEKYDKIMFVIYDHITSAKDTTVYSDRRQSVCKMVQNMKNPYWMVSRVLIGAEIDVAIKQMHRGEIEGLVLKQNNSTYYASTKSRSRSCWKKVKAVHTDDVVIFGAIEGQGKYEGMIGALSVGKYQNGEQKVLTTVSGFTDEQRRNFEQMFDISNGEYTVKTPNTIEIAFMEKTHLGGYRHPRFIRFRPDKDPSECTIAVETKGIKTLDEF